MDRNELQNNAVEEMLQYKRVILEWGTGSGKTKPTVDFINRLSTSTIDFSCLILVAERAHIENWRKEFIKFLGDEQGDMLFSKCTVICYASLKKYTTDTFSAVICDEAHHLFTPIRLDYISTVNSDYWILLSATISDKRIGDLSRMKGFFHKSRFTLQESIDNNFVGTPEFRLVPMILQDTYRSQKLEIKLSKDATKILNIPYESRWKYLKNKKAYKDYILSMDVTPKMKYDHYENDVNYWANKSRMNPSNPIYKRMWMLAGAQRKRAMGEMKLLEANRIVNRLRKENKRFICFCSSIEQAEMIGGKNAVSSINSKSQSVIERFNSKRIDELFAIQMLQEGMNLTDIDAGVIVQIDGKDRAFLQKSGRILRGKQPVIYILYFKGTKDEDYVNSALENIDNKYIRKYENSR